MGGGLEDIGKFFNTIGKIFTAVIEVGHGVQEIFEGVLKEVTTVPVGLVVGGLSVSEFIQYVLAFALTNFYCAMKLGKNIFYCMGIYIGHSILTILYSLTFGSLFWLLGKFGADAKGLEQGMLGFADIIDRWCIDNIGIHIFHVSKENRQLCYNCKRLKPTIFIDKITEFGNDINDPILDLLFGGVNDMIGGFSRIANALSF